MRDDRPEQRESIWSVPSRWHGWYFLVFTVMAVLSTGYIGWEEYHNPENKGFYATLLHSRLSPVIPAKAGIQGQGRESTLTA